MPMLAFFPWLRLREEVRVASFRLFPHTPGNTFPVDVETAVEAETLNKVATQYRSQPNLVVPSLCVLQYDGRPLGGDFDEIEREAIFRFGRHLAVAGMSKRRFLGGLDTYTAGGHYSVVIQCFAVPFEGSVVLNHRRKGGYASVFMGQSDVHFILPAHLVSQGKPELDLQLLHALESGVPTLVSSTREHVDASITHFLLANSDSPDVPREVEIVATYSALEQLADSHNLGKVQVRLKDLFDFAYQAPMSTQLRDELPTFDAARPVFSKWVNQICKVRGRLAHGKSADGYVSDWLLFEHLVAGAFVYPLALKCLLSEHELYEMSNEDIAHILGVENLLADRPFFEIVPEQAGSTQAKSEEDTGSGEGEEESAHTEPVAPKSTLGWLRQFKAINDALLSVEIWGTIRRASDEIEARKTVKPE